MEDSAWERPEDREGPGLADHAGPGPLDLPAGGSLFRPGPAGPGAIFLCLCGGTAGRPTGRMAGHLRHHEKGAGGCIIFSIISKGAEAWGGRALK